MGTYSQPSRILDESLSKSTATLTQSVNSAIKSVEAQRKLQAKEELDKVKKQQAELEKQKKEQAERKEESTKSQIEFEETIDEKVPKKFGITDYDPKNITIGIAEADAEVGEGVKIPNEDLDKYKIAVEKYSGLNLSEDELNKALEEDGLDPNIYYHAQDEFGKPLEEQGVEAIANDFTALSNLTGEERNVMLKKIATEKREYIEMMSRLNAATNILKPGQGNVGGLNVDGQYKAVNKGQKGVPLYFVNDPDFPAFSSFVRDYTLGINKGRFKSKYDDEGHFSVEYTYPTKNGKQTYTLNNKELERLLLENGELLALTDGKKYETYKSDLYKASGAAKVKGAVSYNTSTTTGDGGTTSVKQKFVDYSARKARLEVFVQDQIATNGLYDENSRINAQNNWQMVGGPNPKERTTWQYTGTPEQNDKAADELYKDLEAQFIAEDPGITYSSSKEKKETEDAVVSQYKNENAFSINKGMSTYFSGSKDQGLGEYSITATDVYNDFDKLKKDGYKGAVDMLNYMASVGQSSVKFKTGKELSGGQTVVNAKGEKVDAVKDGIYIRVKNRDGSEVYTRRDALEQPSNFLQQIGLYQGITKATMRKVINSIKADEENETSMDNTAPALPIINQA